MAILTPTGDIAQPLEDVRQALSRSVAFRSWTGAANATAALAYIHPNGAEVPDQNQWCYISMGQSTVRLVGFSPATYSFDPAVMLVFCGKPPTTPTDCTDPGNAWTWLQNTMGPILKQLAEDQDGPAMRSITIGQEPQPLALANNIYQIMGAIRIALEPRDFA